MADTGPKTGIDWIPETTLNSVKEISLKRKHKFIIFKIENQQQVVVEKLGPRNSTYENLVNSLPDYYCRYILYDFAYRVGDRLTSKLYLISWYPLNSNQTDKILYTQILPIFQSKLTGVVNFNCNEPEDVEDILNSEVEDNI